MLHVIACVETLSLCCTFLPLVINSFVHPSAVCIVVVTY